MKIWRLLRGQGKWVNGVWLPEEQQQTLTAVYSGLALRSQRDIEGNKRYELRSESAAQPVSRETVLGLRKKRLIETNHKFPSATFLLTTAGEQIAARLAGQNDAPPLSARDFVQENDR